MLTIGLLCHLSEISRSVSQNLIPGRCAFFKRSNRHGLVKLFFTMAENEQRPRKALQLSLTQAFIKQA